MSEKVIDEINSCSNYKYEENSKRIVNLKGVLNADMDEFLSIAYLLDCNQIKYKFTTNIDIRILN